MLRRSTLMRRAEFERQHTFNPESADPPYGDWPHWPSMNEPELDALNDAGRDFLKIVWMAMGSLFIAAIMFAVVMLVWFASMVLG